MNPINAFAAFAARDFRVARSYRIPFVLTFVGIVMTLLTFRFIATFVEGAPALAATGDYFAFVVVGLALSQVLDGALSGPPGGARGEQVQGTLEIMATQPLSAASLATGWAAYPLLQSVVTGIFVLVIAAMMGLPLGQADPFAALLTLVLSGIAFAALGVLGAAIVITLQQGATMIHWVSGALSLISGVYFPLGVLPGWVATISELSPLTHAIRAFRGAILRGDSVAAIAGDLVVLAAFAAVLLPLAFTALSFSMRRARIRGSLATY